MIHNVTDHCRSRITSNIDQHRIQQENGRFSGYGYVSYPGTMALEDLMAEDPAEAYQAEQGLQMGGLE